MINRRAFLAAAAGLIGWDADAPARSRSRQGAPAGFDAFLAGVRSKALELGINAATLDAALTFDQPNPHVLALDQHQPEFVLTWAQYHRRVLTEAKVEQARSVYRERIALLDGISRRYPVDPRIVVSIWGVESMFGTRSGSFGVVDALATLAYDGRRRGFFFSELLGALRILQHGDVEPARMLGSYAGAMGQPQFMPTSFLRYAVDYDGDGRRDIWSTEADVLASIANYLLRNGWVAGAPWGQPIRIPSGFDTARTGRGIRRPLDAWMRLGVRRQDGTAFSQGNVIGTVLIPDGPEGDAFMVYANFDVIRRYNPSDFYSLAVGLLGAATA